MKSGAYLEKFLRLFPAFVKHCEGWCSSCNVLRLFLCLETLQAPMADCGTSPVVGQEIRTSSEVLQ